MMKPFGATSLIGASAFLLLSGCAPDQKLPDLTVGDPNNTPGLCYRNGSDLTLHVDNIGGGDAGGQQVEVKFFMGSGVQETRRNSPGLVPAGSTTSTFVDIPPGCFDPDCEFEITVDIVNEVPESNEGNNVAQGQCIG